MKKITRIGVGGPVGSGKTAIIEAITPKLIDLGIRVLIITNDVVTTEDAKHVQRTLKGILVEERILGVETGACPHTAVREDPSMNLAAVEDMEARFPDTDVVLIESGGDNLTLTFSPALVDFFIYVIDVAAGDKIPRKNGPGITQSDILVINKTDLAPYVGASLEVMEHDSRLMRGRQAVRVHQLQDRRGNRRLVQLIRENVLFDLEPEGGRQHDARRSRPPSSPRTSTSRSSFPAARSARSPCSGFGFERAGRTFDPGLHGPAQRRCSSSAPSTATRGCPTCPSSTSSPIPAASSRAIATPFEFEVGPGAYAHVTTQAATKIHEMDANLRLSDSGRSSCTTTHTSSTCPTPSIPFRHVAVPHPDTHPDRPDRPLLLYAEILMGGRKYYRDGELFQFDLFSSIVRAERPDGTELLTEKFVIEPASDDVRQPGVMGEFDVFGNVILLTPTVARRPDLRSRAGEPRPLGAARDRPRARFPTMRA